MYDLSKFQLYCGQNYSVSLYLQQQYGTSTKFFFLKTATGERMTPHLILLTCCSLQDYKNRQGILHSFVRSFGLWITQWYCSPRSQTAWTSHLWFSCFSWAFCASTDLLQTCMIWGSAEDWAVLLWRWRRSFSSKVASSRELWMRCTDHLGLHWSFVYCASFCSEGCGMTADR